MQLTVYHTAGLRAKYVKLVITKNGTFQCQRFIAVTSCINISMVSLIWYTIYSNVGLCCWCFFNYFS